MFVRSRARRMPSLDWIADALANRLSSAVLILPVVGLPTTANMSAESHLGASIENGLKTEATALDVGAPPEKYESVVFGAEPFPAASAAVGGSRAVRRADGEV